MANTIKLKRSGTASSTPSVDDLDYGELALNYTDEKLYTKNSLDSIVQLGGGSTPAIASIQTGYVNSLKTGSSTGEDVSYLDIEIDEVDITKAVVVFDGGYFGEGTYHLNDGFMYSPSYNYMYNVTARITSSTNLRLSSISSGYNPGTYDYYFIGRWTIVEPE